MTDATIVEWLPYARGAAYRFWLKNRSLDLFELESYATYAVVESCRKYNGTTEFKGYCRTMITRRMIDYSRKVHGRKGHERNTPNAISIDAPRLDGSCIADILADQKAAALTRITASDALDDCVASLTRRERLVLRLRLRGYYMHEIADKIGLSETRCWHIWRAAAEKLAKRFGANVDRVVSCLS